MRYKIATLALVIMALALIVGTLTAPDPYAYDETVPHWVEQGETLWGIARKYSTPKQDVRKVVTLIEEMNNCTATIYPDQLLYIPVFK